MADHLYPLLATHAAMTPSTASGMSGENENESVEVGIAAHPWTPIGQHVGVLCDDRVDQAIDSQISHLSVSLKWCNNEFDICSFQRLQGTNFKSALHHVCAEAEQDLCALKHIIAP